jgi:hypothetical protein
MKSTSYFSGYCMMIATVLFSATYGYSQYVPANTPPKTDNPATSQSPLNKPLIIKKQIICFGFFSPLNHHISIGYDRLVGEDFVLSTQVGIIGPGVNFSSDQTTGGFIGLGPKLFFSPDFVIDGMRRYNAMQGGYFKPELIVSVFNTTYTSYSYSYYNYNQTSTTNTNTFAGLGLMLNFGKQWIIAHCVSLDMYAGIGYGISSTNNKYDTPTNFYDYVTFGSSFPLAFAGGINIGVPF